MTHWNNEPIIMGGYGYEVETYNGQSWEEQEEIPQNPQSYRIVF